MSNNTVDILELVKRNPHEAAMISKLVASRQQHGRHVGDGINTSAVSSMAMDNARRQNDVRIALGLFPDIKLAAQTLISLLLSPTDGVQTEFRYELQADLGLPAPAIADIMDTIKTYLEVDCDLRNRVHDIANKAIIENGANPTLVLPESSLEHFLNTPGTIAMVGESEDALRNAQLTYAHKLHTEVSKIIDVASGIPRPMHILRNATSSVGSGTLRAAMESASGIVPTEYRPHITITSESATGTEKKKSNVDLKLLLTDNVGVLRLPQVSEHLRKRQTESLVEKSRLGYTRYDDKEKRDNNYAINLNDDQIQSNFYRRPGTPTATPFGVIKDPKTIKRRTIGKPLIIDLPPESLLVIPKPSNSREHVYYLAMIDMDGNFVRIDNYEDGFNSLARNFSGHTDNPDTLSSSLMQLANSRYNGNTHANTASELERGEMIRNIYQQLVDTDIKARLRVGFGSDEIKINTSNEHIYEIMLARELSNRTTQLLLIPASLVSYFAFTYDENGIGRSLLDESRNILSIRTMMMVAEVLNSVRNAISRTLVEVNIDSRDKDPMSTAETIKNRVMAGRDGMLPWGSFDLGGMAKQLQRAGIEIAYGGDNKLMPNTSVKYSEAQSQHQMMDDTFREELRKLSLAGFSMTPDLLDGNKQEDLATAVKENRAQLGRRVAIMSTEFNGTLKGFVKNLVKYNGTIYDKINLIVIKNIKYIAKEVYKAKSLPSDIINLITPDKETKKLNKKNVWTFVKYITDLIIDSVECTLPTYQRNSFKDRIDELKEKEDALDFLLDNTFNEDALKGSLAGVEDSESYITAAKATIKASVIRGWFAEAGIDDVIGRYIEKPNTSLTNTATKEINDYNQKIISLIMGMKKGDSAVSELVKILVEKMDLAGDDDGSDSDSSSDSDDDSGSDSDGVDDDSGGDDEFADLDDMFGGTSLDDDSDDDGGDSEDKSSDDSGSDDSSDDSESEDSSSDEA